MAQRIIDLTGVSVSGNQQPADVVGFRSTADQQKVISLLMADGPLEWHEICSRANQLANIAVEYECDYAILPNRAWIVSALEYALQMHGIQPMCKMGQELVRLHTLDPRPVM